MDELRNEVISFLQDLLTSAKIPLSVTRVPERLFIPLCAELNWDWALQYLNDPNHFDFSINLQSNGELAGLSVGIYKNDSKTLEIQAIESFVRNDNNHPLKGKMVLLTIIAATYFTLLSGGLEIHIIDPDELLIPYYNTFGFELLLTQNGDCRMTSQIQDLVSNLDAMINNV